MAGACRPGPLGSGPTGFDSGTLCRGDSPQHGSLGLEPLSIDRAFLDDARRRSFQYTVHEALRRGARDYHLFLLRAAYLDALTRATVLVPGSALEAGIREAESAWADIAIDNERDAFSKVINEELVRIRPIVGQQGLIKDRDDYQFRARPLYHSQGYTDPAKFLERVGPYNFLGKGDVWVHQDLADKLKRVAPILNGWTPGLSASVSREFRSAMGIQIRTIAGTESLSNHAFGLAIDVDAYSNPHVVKRAAIDALNAVVQRTGIQYDFGKFVLSESERIDKDYTADDVMEVFNRGRNASEAVRNWLRAHLPRYKKQIEEMKPAEKTLGLKHVASSMTLDERVAKAAEARGKLAHKRPATPAEDEAVKTIERVCTSIEADEELRRIQVLYENFPDSKYIDTWYDRGLLTIPLLLAVVLVAELKLRWGEQYESSKDAMHFELMGAHDRPHIPADIPLKHHEKHRTLARLMADSGPKPLHLEVPAFLKDVPRHAKPRRK